jgi:hypothetical protein
MSSFEGDEGAGKAKERTIDGTSDAGLAQLQSLGFPVSSR